MQKPKISSRDVEQLSAHLDGKLAGRQLAALEARLAAEPQLRQAQAQLQHTRAMLRRAPQRKLRRSFILTPATAGERAPAGWSGFNFASAAASLALVLVLIADFSVNGLPMPTAAMKEPAAVLMAEAAEEAGAAMAPMPSAEAFTLETPPADQALDAAAERAPSPTSTLAQNAGALEAVLASIAAISGLIALHRRRR